MVEVSVVVLAFAASTGLTSLRYSELFKFSVNWQLAIGKRFATVVCNDDEL